MLDGMDWIVPFFDAVRALLAAPLFSVGGNGITAGTLFGVVLTIVLAWWLAALLERAIQRLVARKGGYLAANSASVLAWARISRYLLWALATVVGLEIIGVNLSSLALIGGAIGVGIGFGLQNIFSNFISGIILLMEKTLKIGDFVDLQSGIRGHVREIGLRFTRITTNDEVDVIVPNSEFINGRVVNWTFQSRYRRIRVPFGVAHGSDKAAVREAGLRAAAKVTHTVDEEGRRPEVWLTGMGDSALNFQLVVWVGSDAIARPGSVEAKYMWHLHDELVAAGLEIPFPQRDLRLRSGPLRVQVEPVAGPDAPAAR